MALCRLAPERVDRLCLMSTNSKAPTDQQRAGWRTWRDRLAAGESPRDLQAGILDSLLSSAAQARDPDLEGRILRMGDDTGAAALDAQLRLQDSRVDESASLARLTMPMLVVSGALDVICPPQFHEDIAAAVPHSRLAAVDAGHLAPMEQPRDIGRLIAEWLRA